MTPVPFQRSAQRHPSPSAPVAGSVAGTFAGTVAGTVAGTRAGRGAGTGLGGLRLSLLALVLSLLLPASASWAQERISAKEAYALAQAGDVTLIDIRTPREWRQTGVPSPAATLNVYEPTFLQDLMTLLDGDMSRPVAFICAVGGRSGQLSSILTERGFTRIYDVSEGMKGSGQGPGWLKDGLPTLEYR